MEDNVSTKLKKLVLENKLLSRTVLDLLKKSLLNITLIEVPGNHYSKYVDSKF
jgi:hypothetical protein